MKDPFRQLPSESKSMICMSAMPTPSTSPPCTWPSMIISLIRVPQSSTATNRRTLTTPVPGSTSTTHMYAPNGKVRFGGSYVTSASRLPSTPSGSVIVPCAASATSWIVFPCDGSPLT